MIEPHEYALNQRDKEIAKQEELFEEWQELTQPHFEAIEDSISHINNKSEAFNNLDLDEEIKSRIAEFLPKTIDKKDIEMLALLQIANERIAELQKRLDEKS